MIERRTLRQQASLHVLAALGGDHRCSSTHEHIALELEHSLFFLDQQHPAVNRAFMLPRRQLSAFPLPLPPQQPTAGIRTSIAAPPSERCVR